MINLALVGYGNWGRNYVRTAKNIPGICIKYICTSRLIDPSVRKQTVVVRDYKDLSKFNDIDGVIIATPASTHFIIAKYFLEMNQNLLIEKPLTTSYKDALSLEKLTMKNNSIVMIGHIYLYNQAFQTLKRTIKEIGKIRYVDCEGMDWGPFRTDTSVLWDWAPHDVSMCIELFGQPNTVQAWSLISTNEMIQAQLSFSQGIKATIKIGWLSPIKKRQILIVGTKGSLLFDDTKDQKLLHLNNKDSILYSGKQNPLQNELEAFIDSIKKKKTPYSSFEKALKVIYVIDALEKSLMNNSKIISLRATR